MAMTSETKLLVALLAVGAVGAGYYLYRQRQKQADGKGALPADSLPPALPQGPQSPQASLSTPASAPADVPPASTPDSPPPGPAPAPRAPWSARVARTPFARRAIPANAHTFDTPDGTWWWLEDGARLDAKRGVVTNVNAPSSGVVLGLHSPKTGATVKVPIGAEYNVINGTLKLPVSTLD